MLVITSVSREEIRTKHNRKERNLTCLGNWENLPLQTLKELSGSLRNIRSDAITFYMVAAPTSRCTFSCDLFSQQSETKLLTV